MKTERPSSSNSEYPSDYQIMPGEARREDRGLPPIPSEKQGKATLDFEGRREAEGIIELISNDEDALRQFVYQALALRSATAASLQMSELWAHVRLLAEGSDWNRETETLPQWAFRKIRTADNTKEREGKGG